MTVLKASITFENKWMATRINAAAACPTLEGEEVGWAGFRFMEYLGGILVNQSS